MAIYARGFEPFISDLRIEDSSFIHLQYAGCGSISALQTNLFGILQKNYQPLFPNMAGNQIRDAFVNFSPVLKTVFEYFDASNDLKSFSLTSVGIAIANAHFTSKFPTETAPLSIWIK